MKASKAKIIEKPPEIPTDIDIKLVCDAENNKLYLAYLKEFDALVTIHYWKHYENCPLFIRDVVISTTQFYEKDCFTELRRIVAELLKHLEPTACNKDLKYFPVVRTKEEFFSHWLKERGFRREA